MDPQLSNDEQNLRDKILQHAFPFDQKAWEDMQRLLDAERDSPPPPIPPSAETDARPGPSGLRKWLPLLLLLLSAAGLLALWQNHRQQKASKQGADPFSAISGQGETSAIGQYPHRTTTTLPANTQKQGDAGAGNEPQNPDDAAGSPAQTRDGSANRGLSRSGPGALSAKGTGADTPSATNILPQAPQTNPETTVAAHDGAGLLPPTAEPDSTAIRILPALLDTLPLVDIRLAVEPRQSDSIIRPAPPYTNPNPLWARAWIFGVNATAVDQDPLRISVLPHIGYLWRYQLARRTAVQGEVILKYATGYQWRAEFFDAVPGASSQLILENNNLLFIELPLTLQRQVSAGHTWVAGLKPALVFPVFPSTTNAGSNFGAPRRNYTMRDGVRYVDLGLVVGWEYRFARRWSLDVRYNQGLFDLTIDNFFRSTETHLNSDLQISLRHFVFKKDKPEKK